MAHELLLSAARPAATGFEREPYLVQPHLLARNAEQPSPERPNLDDASGVGRSGFISLAAVWNQLASQHLVILDESYSDAQESSVTLSSGVTARAPTRTAARDFVVLRRTLTGEPRKCIADDLDIAQSTVSTACSSGLRAFGLGPSVARAPLLLMLAAHAASRSALSSAVHNAVLIAAGPFWIVRAACSDERLGRLLTNSERSVMRLLLRGRTRAQIALDRSSSERTVANQLNAVFRKLRVSGRAELVGRLISTMREI